MRAGRTVQIHLGDTVGVPSPAVVHDRVIPGGFISFTGRIIKTNTQLGIGVHVAEKIR